MAHFVYSAFADEAATDLGEQMRCLSEEGISMLELRGVDGINCADLNKEEALSIHKKLAKEHITLSALGSPFGKIGITDPFEGHLKQFEKTLEICKILECTRIRMFSFYIPHEEEPEKYRYEVLSRLEKMIELAGKADILLVHENEKGIYGDTPERCMELYRYFDGEMGIAFDPANYVQCGVDPLEAYQMQKDTITYFHMKDALKDDGSVVCVGQGDGSVPEILCDVNRSRKEDVILTIEPHLHIFDGAQTLQEEALRGKVSYANSRTAFHAACEAMRKCMKEVEEKSC